MSYEDDNDIKAAATYHEFAQTPIMSSNHGTTPTTHEKGATAVVANVRLISSSALPHLTLLMDGIR
jgi:hypothetical protein